MSKAEEQVWLQRFTGLLRNAETKMEEPYEPELTYLLDCNNPKPQMDARWIVEVLHKREMSEYKLKRLVYLLGLYEHLENWPWQWAETDKGDVYWCNEPSDNEAKQRVLRFLELEIESELVRLKMWGARHKTWWTEIVRRWKERSGAE